MSQLSPQRIEQLLQATEEVTLAKERGDLLEELAAHVLGSIPGVKVTDRDVINVHGSEEIDLALLNRQHADGLDVFEPFIFAECKNTKGPVDSKGLGAFARKLESRNTRLGILFTRFGITGDAEKLRAAQHVLSSELSKGREILVITGADLAELNSNKDAVELLLRRRSSLLANCGFVEDHGWYGTQPDETSDREPQVPRAEGSRGRRCVKDAIREEKQRVAQELLEREQPLPENDGEAAGHILDRSNELLRLLETAILDDELESWKEVLGELLELGGVAVAYLYRHGGWEKEPSELAGSAESYAPNIRHVPFSSSLYRDMVSSFTLETVNAEDLDGRVAALALVGLVIESCWRLEDSLDEYVMSLEREDV